MKRNKGYLWKSVATIAFFACASPYYYAMGQKTELEVVFTDIRSDKGRIWVSLYKNAEGFPSVGVKAFQKENIAASTKGASVIFKDLPTGEYAVSCYHDENADGHLSTNFLGLPVEGYGASNDAPARFGPPKYEDARFTLPLGGKRIVVRLRY